MARRQERPDLADRYSPSPTAALFGYAIFEYLVTPRAPRGLVHPRRFCGRAGGAVQPARVGRIREGGHRFRPRISPILVPVAVVAVFSARTASVPGAARGREPRWASSCTSVITIENSGFEEFGRTIGRSVSALGLKKKPSRDRWSRRGPIVVSTLTGISRCLRGSHVVVRGARGLADVLVLSATGPHFLGPLPPPGRLRVASFPRILFAFAALHLHRPLSRAARSPVVAGRTGVSRRARTRPGRSSSSVPRSSRSCSNCSTSLRRQVRDGRDVRHWLAAAGFVAAFVAGFAHRPPESIAGVASNPRDLSQPRSDSFPAPLIAIDVTRYAAQQLAGAFEPVLVLTDGRAMAADESRRVRRRRDRQQWAARDQARHPDHVRHPQRALPSPDAAPVLSHDDPVQRSSGRLLFRIPAHEQSEFVNKSGAMYVRVVKRRGADRWPGSVRRSRRCRPSRTRGSDPVPAVLSVRRMDRSGLRRESSSRTSRTGRR